MKILSFITVGILFFSINSYATTKCEDDFLTNDFFERTITFECGPMNVIFAGYYTGGYLSTTDLAVVGQSYGYTNSCYFCKGHATGGPWTDPNGSRWFVISRTVIK